MLFYILFYSWPAWLIFSLQKVYLNMTLHAVLMVKTCKSTNSTIPDCQKFTYNLGFVCLIEIAASFTKWSCQAGMQEKKTAQRVVMQKEDACYFFNWQSFLMRIYQCCDVDLFYNKGSETCSHIHVQLILHTLIIS